MDMEERAPEILEPLLPRFFKCVEVGLERYAQDLNRRDHHKRTGSNIRWDYICTELTKEFDDVEGVTITRAHSSFSMDICGELDLRVKKLDKRFLPHNIITQRNLFTVEEVKQPHLPGMEPPKRIELGYRFNDEETRTTYRVFLRRPAGLNRHRWVIELKPEMAEVAEVPAEQTPAQNKRVHIKETSPAEEVVGETDGN
jgi:hypothetical protein